MIKRTWTETKDYEARYFAETDDGFDGTAQGYGYKSMEKLQKAYWYYKNKDKIRAKKKEARRFLRENPKINRLLKNYFSVDNCVYALKCGETLSIGHLIRELNPDEEEIKSKLLDVKHLWRTLENEI